MGTIIIVLLVCAFIASAVGNTRDRGNAGFVLGLLLGPLGIIIAALLPRPEVAAGGAVRSCPWCAEPIQRDAVICKHCTRDV